MAARRASEMRRGQLARRAIGLCSACERACNRVQQEQPLDSGRWSDWTLDSCKRPEWDLGGEGERSCVCDCNAERPCVATGKQPLWVSGVADSLWPSSPVSPPPLLLSRFTLTRRNPARPLVGRRRSAAPVRQALFLTCSNFGPCENSYRAFALAASSLGLQPPRPSQRMAAGPACVLDILSAAPSLAPRRSSETTCRSARLGHCGSQYEAASTTGMR